MRNRDGSQVDIECHVKVASEDAGWPTRVMSRLGDGCASVGRLLLLGTILLCLASRGAVTPVALALTAISSGLLLAFGAAKPPLTARARSSYDLCVSLVISLIAYCLFQSWSFPGNLFANPAWTVAGDLLNIDGVSISVAPAQTRTAIPSLISPFLFYAATLCLFRTQERAMRLLAWLALIGSLFAIFGFLQLVFIPKSLLFGMKTAYLDSLTSVVVNRNTAGTLLGVASFAALAVMIDQLIDSPGRPWHLPDIVSNHRGSFGRRSATILSVAAFGITLVALVLTKSRGALLATSIAYLVVLPVLAIDTLPQLSRRVRGLKAERPRLYQISVALGTMVLVLLMAGMLGAKAINRLEMKGIDTDRLCVYAATFRGFWDHWLFGTGFGTFELAFPAYRPPGCGEIGEIFVRAHNVYLEGLMGLGIPFGLLVLCVVVHLSRVFSHGLRHRLRMRHVPVIGIGGLLLVVIHSALDFSLQIPGMAIFFACFLGAVTTISVGQPGLRGAQRWSRFSDHPAADLDWNAVEVMRPVYHLPS